jgi:hypothetical protein
MPVSYIITTNPPDDRNSEPARTDSLDEALMIAERWAAEIIHNLRPDYPHISASMIDGGRFWVIANGFGGERLRTVKVTENSATYCSTCQSILSPTHPTGGHRLDCPERPR